MHCIVHCASAVHGQHVPVQSGDTNVITVKDRYVMKLTLHMVMPCMLTVT